MNGAVESVILCEGYHDRAFWKGWLERLGCTDPGVVPGKAARVPVPDPWGVEVKGGVFAYHSPSGHFIRVEPCRGKEKVIPQAMRRLRRRGVERIQRLVINVDADVHADGAPNTGKMLGREAVEGMLRRLGLADAIVPGNVFPVDGGATEVCLIRWETPDPPCPELPHQQTLERLVCSAIHAAYPDRAPAVRDWLASRPAPPTPSVKEHAWSHMAGWFAEHGCDDFYRCLWEDPLLATEMETRLRASGAWDIVAALAA